MAGNRSRQDDLILNMLVEHGLLKGLGGMEVEQAAGGLNSRVFFVRAGGRVPVYTVRLAVPSQEWMLRREADILRSIDRGCDCAPQRVHLFESDELSGGLLLVHAYAEGSTAPLGSVTDQRLRSLGGCLAAIHAHTGDRYTVWPDLEPTTGTRADAFHDRLAATRRYETFSHAPGSPLNERIQRLFTELASIELHGAGWDDTLFSLLQGDTSIGNIIWHRDSVALIDWEYARHGDPAEEIAYLLTEQPLGPEPTSLLFQSYIVAGGEAEALIRAAYYAPLTALDSALWWGDHHTRSGIDPASSREVPLHLGRAEEALQVVTQPG